ncbi:MAG: GHKL domain-containing protein [Pseudorhodoplanes sp.]|nr:GHKL domain-containing protein [Pseudorhodoplanes sp.]
MAARHLSNVAGAIGFILYLNGIAELALASAAPAPQAEARQVLLLHSFGRDFKPWSEYAKAIRLELERQSPWPLDLQEHALITARSADDNPEAAFVEYLNALFVKRRPDLIVAIGAPAADFVQRQRARLFPTTPMILAAVDQRRVKYSVLGPHDVVAAVSIDYEAAIENILKVLPDTNHIAIVVGTSPIEKFWKEEIVPVAKRLEGRVKFTWYDAYSFDDILKHAAALPPNSAIFWELMIVDAAGVVHEEGRTLSRLHAVTSAPIFSYTDAFFGKEIVGGPQVPVLEAAERVGAAAVRLLAGEDARAISVPLTGMGTPKYDWRELQRWGISESILPPGSEIAFRSPTIWDQYRLQILGICAAVVVQALIITWLLYEHRRRHLAEVLARSTMAELQGVNRLAAAGQLSASIAHEVRQPLQAAAANAYAARNWLAAGRQDIDEARSSLDKILDSVRRANDVVSGIRAMFDKDRTAKSPVDMNEVIRTVLTLINLHLRRHRIELETDLDNTIEPIEGHRTQLQQVILNLAMNAIESMQSCPKRILRIRSRRIEPHGALITVQDSGTGIAAADLERVFRPLFTTKSGGMGMGLSICRSIVEAHGGRMKVSSPAEGGSILEFDLRCMPQQ